MSCGCGGGGCVGCGFYMHVFGVCLEGVGVGVACRYGGRFELVVVVDPYVCCNHD